MATLTSKQKEVIRKIIYAVETGGQIYGKQNYSAFTGAGANTPNEVAITIGAGQWYATEAKTLLSNIRSKDKATFNKLDTAGIGEDLDKANWSRYVIDKSSEKAKCIVSIISSPVGIKCQDELMEKQITAYATSIQKTHGDMTPDAIAECINVRHQGGNGVLNRILSRAEKPYSAKSIKASLDLDIKDKSSSNQVGDYATRQTRVYDMINKYILSDMVMDIIRKDALPMSGGKVNMTEKELREAVAKWPVQFMGLEEGDTQHLAILETFNNSRLCTRYKMTTKDAWCATTVSATFIALGLAGAPGTGKLFECVECSCGNMVSLARNQVIWKEADDYVPQVGDIIMYNWDDPTESTDNTGWPDHVGIVSSVDGRNFVVIEGNYKNSVTYRAMKVNAKYIRGYITPEYAKFAKAQVVESKPTTTDKPTTKPATTTSSSKKLNKTCKFKGKVTAGELNVRNLAGTKNTEVLRKLKKDTEVDVCDTVKDSDGDDWYYIKESGKYGFVSVNYIAKVTVKKNTALNKTRKFYGKVTAKGGLKVRSWAGTEHEHLRTLKKYTKVEVCDSVKASTGKTWYYIKESGKYGFVSAEYIARI